MPFSGVLNSDITNTSLCWEESKNIMNHPVHKYLMLLITQRYQLGHLCFIRANSEGPVGEEGVGEGGLQDLGEGSHGYQGERGGIGRRWQNTKGGL